MLALRPAVEGGVFESAAPHAATVRGDSMIRHSALKTAMLVVFGGLVAGCSETGFQDFIGAGKYAPDETQVSAGQPLSVPPDLQLRPPSATEPPRVASRPAADQPPAGQLRQPQDLAAAPQPDEFRQPARPAGGAASAASAADGRRGVAGRRLCPLGRIAPPSRWPREVPGGAERGDAPEANRKGTPAGSELRDHLESQLDLERRLRLAGITAIGSGSAGS
jgi:hypothetical protein